MRILFIYPNIEGFYSDVYHFGLASIVASSKKAGHECRVIPVNKTDEIKNVIDCASEFKPEVVGFTSVSSQFHNVKKIAAMIREKLTNVTIVCGGVHTTINPQAILNAPELDGIFVGESELSFVEFLKMLESGNDYRSCDNLAYVKNGILMRNSLKPLLQNLDIVPPPDKEIYPYIEIMKKMGHAQFYFARGCPYQCTFCSNKAIADTYNMTINKPRYRSAESCIQEIEDVFKQYRFHEVIINDDVFGMNKQWLKEFLSKYKERINVKFTCLLRVEMVSEDLLVELKNHCCHRVCFGVESGNEEMRRNVMNRKMTNKQIISAFDLCHKLGFKTLAGNIIGLPGETEEMIWDTINLNKRLNPTGCSVNIYYPYVGTVLGDQCFSNDLIDMELFNNFSNERRASVLKLSPEFRKKLYNFYDNWQAFIYPNDIVRILRRFLDNVGLMEPARKIKRMIKPHYRPAK